MHPKLKHILDCSIERMQADERVLAGFVSGSAQTAAEDEYSDVDAVFVVQADAFARVVAGLPEFFASMCDRVELVWAERFNTAEHHNYAVLLRVGDDLLQYDISIDTEAFCSQHRVLSSQVLFDKTGCLPIVDERPVEEFTPERIRWYIEAYWVWIYIHAKYLRRSDFVKLVYVQQELFNNHLVVLRNLFPEAWPYGWWPQAVKALPDPDKKRGLMQYLGHADIDSVRVKLPAQIEAFSADARTLCTALQIDYPDQVEAAVLEHLHKSCPDL